ncbi:MAG: hypothetical protein ACI9EF_000203 [Pseudohongiellaceae bacterium]|jgi:hypothetical protein
MGTPKGFAWRRATGLYYSDGRLTVAHASVELTGRKSFSERTIDVPPEDLEETVKSLKEEGALKGHVICSLDSRTLFSITRKLTDEELLRGHGDVLKADVGTIEGGIATGSLPVKIGATMYRSLYAFQQDPVRSMLNGLGKTRTAQRRMLPVSVALVPLVRRKSAGRPKAWNTWVSILPGPGFGVALLCCGKLPVAMRLFHASQDEISASGVESAVRGLQSFCRNELSLDQFDGILVHVGPDAGWEPEAESLGRITGWNVTLGARLIADESTLARGLAEYGLNSAPVELDLFSDLVEVYSLFGNLPVKSLLGVTAAMGISAFFLFWQAFTVETEGGLIAGQAKALASQAGVKVKGLADIHKKTKKEVRLAAAFVSDRLFWEDFLREIPLLIPEQMNLERLDGRNRVAWSETSSAETRLSITTELPLPVLEGTPIELTRFTEAVKESELFQRKLPKIRGSNMRFQSGARESKARLVLMCGKK